MLIKLFEKHNLSIETNHISLRSAPNLPLSLDQPVKHLLLDDLVVTGMENDYIITSFIINDKTFLVVSFKKKITWHSYTLKMPLYIYNDAIYRIILICQRCCYCYIKLKSFCKLN